MLVIALGLLALGCFVALAESARLGSAAARVGALLESALLAALGGFGVLAAFALNAMGCDERCDENLSPEVRTGHWWHSQDAWQWWGQILVASLGAMAVIAALVAVASKRYRAAIALMTFAAACFGAWAAVLAPLGNGLGI